MGKNTVVFLRVQQNFYIVYNNYFLDILNIYCLWFFYILIVHVYASEDLVFVKDFQIYLWLSPIVLFAIITCWCSWHLSNFTSWCCWTKSYLFSFSIELVRLVSNFWVNFFLARLNSQCFCSHSFTFVSCGGDILHYMLPDTFTIFFINCILFNWVFK